MQVSKVFIQSHILVGLRAKTKKELFDELANHLGELDDEIDVEEVVSSLWKREEMLNTKVADFIAIPHTQVRHLGKTTGVLGISAEGVDYGLSDGSKIKLVAMIIDDQEHTIEHLDTLRNFAILAKNPRFVQQIIEAKDSAEAFRVLARYEEILA